MASEAGEPTGYVSADDEPELETPVHVEQAHARRRIATVYDAVAGRVSNKDPRHEDGERSGGPHIKHSEKDVPFAPDEVLFRRKDAPQRYAEHDIYFSHDRDLPHGGRDVLPESDLLKAIHSYSSHFYAATSKTSPLDYRRIDSRSMDETALLAFGILLEEAGREVLGQRGDLVFTEAAESQTEDDGAQEDHATPSRPRVAVGVQDVGHGIPARKRRRVKGPVSSPASDVVKGGG